MYSYVGYTLCVHMNYMYFNYRNYQTHRISEVKCSLDEIVDLVNWRKVHQMLHAYSIVTLDYCGGTERGRRRERERERERERKGE